MKTVEEPNIKQQELAPQAGRPAGKPREQKLSAPHQRLSKHSGTDYTFFVRAADPCVKQRAEQLPLQRLRSRLSTLSVAPSTPLADMDQSPAAQQRIQYYQIQQQQQQQQQQPHFLSGSAPAPAALDGGTAGSGGPGPQHQQQHSTSVAFGSGGLFGSTSASPGTALVMYQPTTKQDGFSNVALQSISAMQQFENKTHEELRFEDYARGNKGPACTADAAALARADLSSYAPGAASNCNLFPLGLHAATSHAPAAAAPERTWSVLDPAPRMSAAHSGVVPPLAFRAPGAAAPEQTLASAQGGLFGAPAAAPTRAPAPSPFTFGAPAAAPTRDGDRSTFDGISNTGPREFVFGCSTGDAPLPARAPFSFDGSSRAGPSEMLATRVADIGKLLIQEGMRVHTSNPSQGHVKMQLYLALTNTKSMLHGAMLEVIRCSLEENSTLQVSKDHIEGLFVNNPLLGQYND